ncbi:ankyrin repeat-containing domain protein [Xylariaceae sp. FL0255]|nr:ankyrin repeat-containing domain protein [Xylariaceae sp. FL0255]
MDPLSVTTNVVGLPDAVTKLKDLDLARSHALLLRQEIAGLEAISHSKFVPIRKVARVHDDSEKQSQIGSSLEMDNVVFETAMKTGRTLLSDLEASFPLQSEPLTWKNKVRWAIKDKRTLEKLQERLKSTESTLQGIVSMEQLRVSRMIYGMLYRQQSAIEKLGESQGLGNNTINMAIISRHTPDMSTAIIEAQVSEIDSKDRQATKVVTRPNKLLPRSRRASFERWGFSVYLVALPKDKGKGTDYTTGVHISLMGRMYSVRLRVSSPSFRMSPTWNVRNIVPIESEMAVACRTVNFNSAYRLLTTGMARGSDVTPSGWPMLDYAIESGSARLVRLLLEHGAEPDLAYGDYNMTALQSCFLRGKLDIARMLLSRGADIEHVDNDGYSALSYLWVVEKPLEDSVDFMRLCLSSEFSEVIASDSRGWTAFHCAAGVPTPEDIRTFIKLGGSPNLRAEWYGWTPLFFAASHDNVETFKAIVEHSGPDVYGSLDGDGWNLLHCCTYFGAPRVVRMVLENGVDVNAKTHPAPLPEDPELSYKELKASDLALYIGPNRFQMFTDALRDAGRDADLAAVEEIFWDALNDGKPDSTTPIYGAEDVDDRWTLLHWASYNGSQKVKKLLLLKGADPEHLDAIELEENPTLLPTSLFEGR